MFTQEVAEFIVSASPKTIPEEALEVARLLFLDCIGVTLAGSREPASKLIVEYISESGGKPEATVIAAGFKSSAASAALANGVMGHVLDYDDYCLTWIAHPSVAILPGILALGEREKISGREALIAYIAGFQVGASLGIAVGRHHYESGWHNTSTLGSIAATASASKVLNLDVQQTRMALGIAASSAGGLRQNFGTMTKSFHAGKAALNGVSAALLAQKGFTADENIFEAPLGFVKVFGGMEGRWEKASNALHGNISLVSPGVSVKPYPSCGGTHAAIDAILQLKNQYQITSVDVKEIECVTRPLELGMLIHHRPAAGLEGKFSMEYCLARALLDGPPSLKHFTDEEVKEGEVRDLLTKVKFRGEDMPCQVGETPEQVTIYLKDGRSLTNKVLKPKGHPQNPLTKGELLAKYKDCAGVILSDKVLEHSIALLLNLDKLKDINELTGLLSLSINP